MGITISARKGAVAVTRRSRFSLSWFCAFVSLSMSVITFRATSVITCTSTSMSTPVVGLGLVGHGNVLVELRKIKKETKNRGEQQSLLFFSNNKITTLP